MDEQTDGMMWLSKKVPPDTLYTSFFTLFISYFQITNRTLLLSLLVMMVIMMTNNSIKKSMVLDTDVKVYIIN